jgi:hypothetical protein
MEITARERCETLLRQTARSMEPTCRQFKFFGQVLQRLQAGWNTTARQHSHGKAASHGKHLAGQVHHAVGASPGYAASLCSEYDRFRSSPGLQRILDIFNS